MESSVHHFMCGLHSFAKCSFIIDRENEQCVHSAVNSPQKSWQDGKIKQLSNSKISLCLIVEEGYPSAYKCGCISPIFKVLPLICL